MGQSSTSGGSSSGGSSSATSGSSQASQTSISVVVMIKEAVKVSIERGGSCCEMGNWFTSGSNGSQTGSEMGNSRVGDQNFLFWEQEKKESERENR